MLNELSQRIYQANKEKGFWDKERNVGELLMLVTSELGEAMEALRKEKFADMHYYDEMIADGYDWENSNTSFTACFEKSIKDTFEDEIADAIIRLFDLSAGLGIDIEKHIEVKLKYNLNRPKLHGKSF